MAHYSHVYGVNGWHLHACIMSKNPPQYFHKKLILTINKNLLYQLTACNAHISEAKTLGGFACYVCAPNSQNNGTQHADVIHAYQLFSKLFRHNLPPPSSGTDPLL